MQHANVVITEGKRNSIVSRIIAYFIARSWKKTATGEQLEWGLKYSWYTHCFLVVGPQRAIEARLFRIRSFDWTERIKQLEEQGRSYVVMEHPELTVQRRWRLDSRARSLLGKWYDLRQMITFAITGRFSRKQQVNCTSIITHAHKAALGVNLFDNVTDHPRQQDLQEGKGVPQDLFLSKLVPVGFSPSVRYKEGPWREDASGK